MRLIFLIPFLFLLSSCLTGDTKCCEHVSTDFISKGYYLERYKTFCAGVFGEMTKCYLTDSANFRKEIGSYDEHESFFAKLNGDKIEAYNIRSSLAADTVAKETISKTELWNYHHTAKDCFSIKPVFGNNTIRCDNDFYPAFSYKTSKGYYMTQIQFKCNSDYSNAVFYTDSTNFCVFIGIYVPGSFENIYSVQQAKGNFEFYNVTEKQIVDTLKVQTYLLSDLKKGQLINACK